MSFASNVYSRSDIRSSTVNRKIFPNGVGFRNRSPGSGACFPDGCPEGLLGDEPWAAVALVAPDAHAAQRCGLDVGRAPRAAKGTISARGASERDRHGEAGEATRSARSKPLLGGLRVTR